MPPPAGPSSPSASSRRTGASSTARRPGRSRTCAATCSTTPCSTTVARCSPTPGSTPAASWTSTRPRRWTTGFARAAATGALRADEDRFVDKQRYSWVLGEADERAPHVEATDPVTLVTWWRTHPAASIDRLLGVLTGEWEAALPALHGRRLIAARADWHAGREPPSADVVEVIRFGGLDAARSFLVRCGPGRRAAARRDRLRHRASPRPTSGDHVSDNAEALNSNDRLVYHRAHDRRADRRRGRCDRVHVRPGLDRRAAGRAADARTRCRVPCRRSSARATTCSARCPPGARW